MIEEHAELKKLWKDFVETGSCSGNAREPIIESWIRCRDLGVSPYLKGSEAVLSGDEFSREKENNRELVEVAYPIMKNIHTFVSGSGFIVALGSKKSVLLDVLGDENILEGVKRGRFMPGVIWSEATGGTNGIGTVLYLGEPLQIFSYEHYCIAAHMFTCSGAPIYDPEDNLIGVINLTGPYKKANPHTLGIAVAAANAIENQLRLSKAYRISEMANNYKSTIINSINEGILVVNAEGKITVSNEIGARFIGLAAEKIVGKSIEEVFDDHNRMFLDGIRKRKYVTDQEIPLYSSSGVVRCMTTTRPITGCPGETVVIFSGMKRARKIAQKMTGAKAHVYFEDLLGQDPAFLRTLEMARTVAGSNSNVLLLGESGTGKDVIAQAIQNASPRREGPFVSINCASIPRDLLSSELFGYEEGAFTGARRGGNPGKFELADGGTIFLDEIGELPPESQVLLLRMLEQKEVIRIGGKEVIPVDIRIIAATNRDLEAACHQGKFRLDLYFRLNVFSIRLPSLRERKGDINLLAMYFAEKVSSNLGKKIHAIEPPVIDKFNSYDWPGNVRELQNVIEHAVNLAKGEVLTLDLLPKIFMDDRTIFVGRERGEQEKYLMKRLMEIHKGNITKVAREMDVARSTVYRKLYKYHLSG